MTVLILIPAAGSSRRMRGADKLLEPIGAEPLLRRQARIAAAVAPVLVTLPPDRPDRLAALVDLGVDHAILADAASGMSASIRHGAGVAAMRGAALLVWPADMPDITAADLARFTDPPPGAILRGLAADGTPGHPVLFPPDLLPELTRISGDQGARPVLQAHADRIRGVPLPEAHALTDLDTPEAWAAWRARN